MNEQPISRPRNRAATVGLVIALIFFIQCVAFPAILVTFMSSWGIRFVNTNPTHPLAGLGETVVELSILTFPLDMIAGSVAIALGTFGLCVARKPERPGARKSILGIVLGILVLLLPFLTFWQWATAFRQ